MGTQGDILIVVHGPGRGRGVPTGNVFMERLQATDPAFAARFRVHETGSGAADLSNVALVLFWLGDPLRESRLWDVHLQMPLGVPRTAPFGHTPSDHAEGRPILRDERVLAH